MFLDRIVGTKNCRSYYGFVAFQTPFGQDGFHGSSVDACSAVGCSEEPADSGTWTCDTGTKYIDADSFGHIVSNGYDNGAYDNSMSCALTFRVPSNVALTIDFTLYDFDVSTLK